MVPHVRHVRHLHAMPLAHYSTSQARNGHAHVQSTWDPQAGVCTRGYRAWLVPHLVGLQAPRLEV